MRLSVRAGLGAAALIFLVASPVRAGSVTGRLLDASGKPVGGAKVVWTPYRTEDEGLLDQTNGKDPAPLGETSTDAQGRFRVPLDRPGTAVALRIVAAGLPSARFAGPFDSTEDVSLLETQMPPAEKLAGRVLDEAGQPVASARVRAIGGEGPFESESRFVAEARTGPDGSFAILEAPSGPRAVAVSAPGYVPFSRFQFEPKPEENVTLRRGGTVRGTLVDAGGKAVAGAIVRTDESAGETDASGMFRIAGVPAGSHSVQAVWKEEFSAHKENVRVRKGEETEVALRLARAPLISGTVIEEATRRPIAGATVSASPAAGFAFGRRRQERTARSDARGRFRLAGLVARRYVVEASREGFLPAAISGISAALSSPGNANLALARAASLSGHALDEKGQPVAGARVRLTRDFNMRAMLRGGNPASFLANAGVLTGPDGSFQLRKLSAGRNLSVEAAKTGYATAHRPGLSLKTGEAIKDVSLVLRKGLEARGRVVDGGGQPVASAEVRTARREAGVGEGRAAIRLAGMDREKPDAVTGADGSFVLKGLEEGEYTVSVFREGFARKSVPSLEVKAKEENVWPPITLSAGLAVAGFVRDAKGDPIGGAQLFSIEPSGGGRPQDSVSEPDGRFRFDGLADRPILLNVSAAGYATVQRTLTPPAQEVIIVLKNSGTLRGRVEDADTKRPITDFTIGRSAPRGGGAFAFVNMGARGGDRSFQSDDGTFELTDVPAGKWTIRASAVSYRSADISGVEVAEGETKEGIVLSLRKGGVLSGRVLDPRKGTGVPNASVSWQAAGPEGEGRFGGAAFARLSGGNSGTNSDADGRFQLDGLPDGKVTVTASHPDFLEVSKDVDPQKEPAVDLMLGTGGSISGTVVGADGRTGVPGAQVRMNAEGDAGLAFGADSTRSDGAGNFLFEHLKAGRFRLTAAGSTGKSMSKEVVLGEGQRLDGVLIEIAMGTLVHGMISGLPAGRLGGVRVLGTAKDYSDSAVSDDAGKFTLRDVPAGVLHLQASTAFLSGRSRLKTVEVPDGAVEFPVEIAFEGTSRLSGRVTRGDRPVGGLFVNAVPDPPVTSGERASGQTDEDGRYTLDGLNEGNYQVWLSGQGVSYRKTLTVSGDTPGDIALPRFSVTGTVSEEGSGEPLEGVTVQAQTGRETATFAMKQGMTDSVGHYFIDDVDSGPYQVTARKSGYELKTHSLAVASESVELNLALRRGAGLTIRVNDGLTGLALHGVSVLAYAANGTVAFQGSVNLDSTGKGEVSSLAPGRYSIYVFSDGYAPRTLAAVDAPAPMIPLAMTPGGRVQVRTETPVTARLVDGSGAIYLLSPWRLDGRVNPAPPVASWDHLAPGPYRLVVSTGGADKSYPFTVAEGATTTVEIR